MSNMLDDLQEQVAAERQLNEALKDYAGQWVAVRKHEVVSHADSLDELMAQIEPDEVESVFRVAEDQQAVCFY
jgi:hypothetical protein